MTVLHIDGFEQYADKTDTAAAIAAVLAGAGYTIRNFNSGTFAIVDGRLAGSLALRMTFAASGTTNPSLSLTKQSTADKVVFGSAFMASVGRSRVIRIENIVDVDWNATTGKLEAGPVGEKVVSQDIFILDAWYYIEVVINKAASQIEIWANDTLQITVPASIPYSEFTATWGQVEAVGSAGIIQYIDDLYVLDSTASAGARTERLGPVQVTTRFPTVDVGTPQWSVVGPNTNVPHYTVAARKATASAATFLQSNTEAARDVFRSNSVLPDDNEVFGVALTTYAKKGDLDNRKIGHLMRVDAVEAEAQIALTATYAFQQTIFERAPGDVAWNKNRVESTEFGIVAR